MVWMNGSQSPASPSHTDLRSPRVMRCISRAGNPSIAVQEVGEGGWSRRKLTIYSQDERAWAESGPYKVSNHAKYHASLYRAVRFPIPNFQLVGGRVKGRIGKARTEERRSRALDERKTPIIALPLGAVGPGPGTASIPAWPRFPCQPATRPGNASLVSQQPNASPVSQPGNASLVSRPGNASLSASNPAWQRFPCRSAWQHPLSLATPTVSGNTHCLWQHPLSLATPTVFGSTPHVSLATLPMLVWQHPPCQPAIPPGNTHCL